MRARFFLYCLKAGALQLLLIVAAILLLCQGALWLQSSALGSRPGGEVAPAPPTSNALALSWSVFSGQERRSLDDDARLPGADSEGSMEGGAQTGSVLMLVATRALNSSWVVALAMVAILGLGIPLGILRGKSRRNPLAWLLAMPSAIGVCLPVYWLAVVAAWWMLDRHGIPLPGDQSANLGVEVEAPGARWLVERWPGFLLAGLIAVGGTGWLVRSVSGGIQFAAEADHLWVSRMRGMRESRLFHRHTLRNALRPLLASVSDLMPFVVGALVLGEGVLGFPGLGGLVFEAGLAQDFALLLPATLLLAVVVLAVRFFAWLIAAWLDPQVVEEVDSRI